PAALTLVEIRISYRQLAMELIDLCPDAVAPGQLGGRRDFELGLVDVVEEREQPVIVALAGWIVLVVVALGAADGQPEKDRARGIDAVDDRLDPELLDVDASLLVDLRIAMKPGGDALRECCVLVQIAGELVDGELIERHIGVEGGDDPVAVFP